MRIQVGNARNFGSLTSGDDDIGVPVRFFVVGARGD
jgi:hypothetical protein